MFSAIEIRKGVFGISVDSERNKMFCTVEGMFFAEEAGDSILAFNKGVSLLKDVSTAELAINCNDLEIANDNILYLLKSCFDMYSRIGFKEVNLIIQEGKKARLQMETLVAELGVNFKFIGDLTYKP
jgi:hypothetical protein